MEALTCSNDPVCSLSQGQGRDSLNLSACYSCTLVPETSCEEFNVFLDRGTVIGTFDKPDMGFYSQFVQGHQIGNVQLNEFKNGIKGRAVYRKGNPKEEYDRNVLKLLHRSDDWNFLHVGSNGSLHAQHVCTV